MKQKSCSMHLFLPGEEKTAELGRKRYEELKKDLEARGYVEHESYELGEDMIVINCPDHIGAAFITLKTFCHNLDVNGPLLGYNPPLLIAIAGQRGLDYPGWIVNIYDPKLKPFYFTPTLPWSKTHGYRLATIEELMTAFPCEPSGNSGGLAENELSGNSGEVEPEGNPIGDWFCDDRGIFRVIGGGPERWDVNRLDSNNEGYVNLEVVSNYHLNYIAWEASHEEMADWGIEPDNRAEVEPKPRKIKKGDSAECYTSPTLERFMKLGTIANEEEPVKEETDWEEQTTIYLRTKDEAIELEITPEGIFLRSVVTPNITDFLRYALQRHDQLKQQ